MRAVTAEAGLLTCALNPASGAMQVQLAFGGVHPLAAIALIWVFVCVRLLQVSPQPSSIECDLHRPAILR